MNRLSLVFTFSIFAFLISACGVSTAEQIDVDSKPLVLPKNVAARPKIVAFGDSLTAGFGLEENESYPYLLQQKLNSEGYNYEVVNAGVSGDTSRGGLERIDWTLKGDNVQILILALGSNDMLRGLPPAKMKENLDRMIQKAQERNIKVLLCGMLAPPTMGSAYIRDFSNAFPDLAEKHKIAYMPFMLENVALQRDLNQADGIHPNAKGARIMTENIYRALQPLLTK
jgi:acyl-CoA thioesterase-1